MKQLYKNYIENVNVIRTDDVAKHQYWLEFIILTLILFNGTLLVQRYSFPLIHPLVYYFGFVVVWLIVLYQHAKRLGNKVRCRTEQQLEEAERYETVLKEIATVADENQQLRKQLSSGQDDIKLTDSLYARKQQSRRKYGFGRGSHKRV